MPTNKDLRTTGIVLRRTNYGETDRILNILTPEGKISAIAKGVRKTKSKLAGGIEIFCLSEIVVHQGKGNIGTLTSAKMLKYYQNIVSDLTRLETASEILKKISRLAEDVDSHEYFDLLRQTLEGINDGINLTVVKIWFSLNFAKLNGEEFNLYVDDSGQKLQPNLRYSWNSAENALSSNEYGLISANEIKLARLMVSSKLKLINHVKNVNEIAANILKSL